MTRIRSFNEDTHKHIIDMVRRDRGLAGRNVESSIDPTAEQTLANWAHVVETVPRAYGIKADDKLPPIGPLDKNPDRYLLSDPELPEDEVFVRKGLCVLYERDPATRLMKRIGINMRPLYNLNFHPIPAGWFVPVMNVSNDLFVVGTNFSWLLKTPSEGIPKATGDTAGSAECDVYRVTFEKKRVQLMDPGEVPIKVECLNWHPSMSIGGDRFIQAKTIDGWATVDVDYC